MAARPNERFALGVTNCRPAREVVAAVEMAERLGAEVAYVAEDVNCRDSFELCALAASGTHDIRLSTGVVNPYTRNPTSLAMAVATLDEISGGRAMLGLGSSSPVLIEDQMGISVGRQVAVMRETAEVVRALLGGELISYSGDVYTYQSAQLSVRPIQPRVPIYFAAMGPMMLRLAGSIADGVLLNVGASTDYIRWAIDQIQIGATRAGRSPESITIAAWLSIYVTEDRAVGLQKAREWLAGMLSISRQGELLLLHAGGDPSILPVIRRLFSAYPHGGDRAAAAAYIPADVAERMALIGDIARIRQRLSEYRAAGVQLPVMSLSAIRALSPGKDDQ